MFDSVYDVDVVEEPSAVTVSNSGELVSTTAGSDGSVVIVRLSDGSETTVLSRAIDETGYVQPTQRELIDARGPGSGPYHLNPITGWRLRANGEVVFRTEKWA